MSAGVLRGGARENRPAGDGRFAASVVESLMARGFAALVTLGIAIGVARVLGPEGRGLYVVAATVGMLGVQLASLGLFSSSVYYLARDQSLLRVLVGNSIVVSLILGSAAAAAILAVGTLPSLDFLPAGLLCALALAWIPIGLMQLLLQSLLLGLQDIRGYNLCEIGTRAAVATLTAAALATGYASVELLVGAAVAGLAAGAVLAFRRAAPRMQGRPLFSWPTLANQIPYGSRAYLATLFGYVVSRADVLVVQHSLGSAQTGIYSIALTIADALYMLPVVIATVLFPRLAALPDPAEKWRVTQRVLLVSAAAMAIVLLSAATIARPLSQGLFGAEFEPAAQLLRIMLPGVFFLGVETIAVQFLNARGFPRAVIVVWVAAAAGKCALLLALVPVHGLEAAAYVTSGTSLFVLVMIAMLIRRDLRRCGREATR